MKVAYIVSRFPKMSETFVLLEALEVKRHHADVVIFPLLHFQEWNSHNEVLEFTGSVRRSPYLSAAVLRTNIAFLFQRPDRYLGALLKILTGKIRPRLNLVKTLVVFPKCVHFAKLIAEARFDWVHAHFATLPSTAAFVIHQLIDLPFSFTAHGSDIHANNDLLGIKLKAADCAFTISNYNLRFITWRTGRTYSHTLSVVHCGVSAANYETRFRMPLSGSGRVRILTVGSLLEVKGHQYLIDACAILAGMNVDFVCEIIGDGPLLGALKHQIASMGLRQRVTLVGGMSRDAVRDQLARADIFVLASVRAARGSREGIPVALMEAMAAGLPVVASRLSGIPELVQNEKSGILVAPKDSAGLAAAISRLICNPHLARYFGETGRAVVRREFSVETSVRELTQRWSQCLESRLKHSV